MLKTINFICWPLTDICTPASSAKSDDPLFQSAPAHGNCRVICFHPWSDLTLPLMEVGDIRHVLDTWASEMINLGKTNSWVQVKTWRHHLPPPFFFFVVVVVEETLFFFLFFFFYKKVLKRLFTKFKLLFFFINKSSA